MTSGQRVELFKLRLELSRKVWDSGCYALPWSRALVTGSRVSAASAPLPFGTRACQAAGIASSGWTGSRASMPLWMLDNLVKILAMWLVALASSSVYSLQIS